MHYLPQCGVIAHLLGLCWYVFQALMCDCVSAPQSITRRSPWRSWTGAARRSWRWTVEASRTTRRSGRKTAGRDTTSKLLDRHLATERASSELLLIYCFLLLFDIFNLLVLRSLWHKMSHCKLIARVNEKRR